MSTRDFAFDIKTATHSTSSSEDGKEEGVPIQVKLVSRLPETNSSLIDPRLMMQLHELNRAKEESIQIRRSEGTFTL